MCGAKVRRFHFGESMIECHDEVPEAYHHRASSRTSVDVTTRYRRYQLCTSSSLMVKIVMKDSMTFLKI
jgi:hypothetical protein